MPSASDFSLTSGCVAETKPCLTCVATLPSLAYDEPDGNRVVFLALGVLRGAAEALCLRGAMFLFRTALVLYLRLQHQPSSLAIQEARLADVWQPAHLASAAPHLASLKLATLSPSSRFLYGLGRGSQNNFGRRLHCRWSLRSPTAHVQICVHSSTLVAERVEDFKGPRQATGVQTPRQVIRSVDREGDPSLPSPESRAECGVSESSPLLLARFCLPCLELPLCIIDKMQEKVVSQCGIDIVALREAPALDFEVIKALEVHVIQQSAADPVTAALAFECLYMAWAWMLYDDALPQRGRPRWTGSRGHGYTAWQSISTDE